MKNNQQLKSKIIEFIEILVIATICSILFIVLGRGHRCLTNYAYSDIEFHLNRIIGLSNIINHPINYKVFNQIGMGVNYFYPGLKIFPAALLIKFTHSVVKGFLAFLFLLNVISGMIAYYSLKSVYKNRFKATIFSTMFIFMTYRALDIYRRFDIGECLAMTFMLIVFSAMYQIIVDQKNSWGKLAIGMALVLYSHLLSAIIVSIMCGLMLILNWKNVKSWKFVIIQLCKSGITTFTLGLGFLLPYLQQTRLKINPPFIGNLPSAALNMSDLFNNSLNNTLGNSKQTVVSLGIICLVFLIIGLFKKHKTSVEKSFYMLGLFSVILSTKLFPWNLFQKHFALLQFPWRFLEVASVFLLIYGVSAVIDSKRMIFSLGIVGCTVMLFYSSVVNLENTASAKNIMNESRIDKAMSYDNWDYFPQKAAYNLSIVNHQFFNAKGKQVSIKHWVTDTDYVIKLNSYKSSKLNVPVLYYYGTQAKINGKNTDVKVSNRGTVEIQNVPQNGEIEITSRYTKFARIGQIISVISLLGLMVLIIRNCFRTRSY